jgi:hypothetical protein
MNYENLSSRVDDHRRRRREPRRDLSHYLEAQAALHQWCRDQ